MFGHRYKRIEVRREITAGNSPDNYRVAVPSARQLSELYSTIYNFHMLHPLPAMISITVGIIKRKLHKFHKLNRDH